MKQRHPPPIWFDPQLKANSKALISAIDSFRSYIESREVELGVRARSRTLSAKQSFDLAVQAMCCNLIVARMVGAKTLLAVPLSSGMMWGRGRYGNPVYGKNFLGLVAVLEKLGLLKREATGYFFSSRAKAPSLFAVPEQLSSHFPNDVMRWSYIRREVDRELIVLKADKDEDGRSPPIEYQETKDTKRWRGQVARINRWLASADIELLPDPEAACTDEDGYLIASFRRSLHRTFNNGSFRQGGRLSGFFHMAMKRDERFRRIRINGERIADVDYQQLYPRLAYARARAEPPDGDFYNVVGDGSSRDGWKILINAMLFAEKRLRGWPDGARHHFADKSIKRAVAMVERKHAPIAHLFGKGLGYELMWMESEILIGVITLLFKMGIPALPLHDAVLVARSHAETAKDVMEHDIECRIGYRRATVKIDFGPP